MSTLWLMVGLPASGKTTRALQLAADQRALRLTPDEWMIPLFGESDAGGRRDVLEGRLIAVALEMLALGTDVILDFGFWSVSERSALRSLATSVGAGCQVIYLPVDDETQMRRIEHRWSTAPHTTFDITAVNAESWRATFDEPTSDELTSISTIDPPPPWRSWLDWASARWPSLRGRPAATMSVCSGPSAFRLT